MPENLLAIDNGTQSVRALLFDPKGTLLAKQRVPIVPYYSTAPGLAEQKPEVFWDAVCEACRGLWKQGVDKSSIAAVAVTTQRSTVLNVDEQGKPLRPAIHWLDQRRTEGLPPVSGFWGAAFKVAGASETVAYLQAEAEANWIRTHEPEIWKSTYKYLLLSGYLTFMLTGRFVDSVGCQVGYIPFDYKSQAWAAKSDWKWQAIPMDPALLPELVPQGQTLGEISEKASQETGIPKGLPLIAAAADKACEVLGAGALEPNVACLSYGTTATINTTHEKYIEVIPLIPPYPAAEPGEYNFEIQIYRGYWMVNWFRQEFGHREEQMAAELGVEPESLFDDLVKAVPPGSQGLVLQPYWSPGLRNPGPEAAVPSSALATCTRVPISTAPSSKGWPMPCVRARSAPKNAPACPSPNCRVAGGGSQSAAAMQLTADVFGLPASKPHIYEASGLGAAMDAAVGAGIQPDFASAVKDMTHLGETYSPDAQAHAVYEELYNDIYLKMYAKLQPFYKKMRQLGQKD